MRARASAPMPLPKAQASSVSLAPPATRMATDAVGLGKGALAALLQAPINVRSRVGHGTVFSFEVAPGKAQRALEPAVLRPSAPLGLTLQGRLLLVVEDEAAVREGIVVLLKAWGASVVDFDAVASLQAWLGAAAAQQPDLLLVDYRLPQALTGLDALAAARAHWPQRTLPAIVITGSTMSALDLEAQQKDFHLLIKPVLPNKLRAMIAFKLGVR